MKNARNKGQRGEREVIEEIRKMFGVKYARTPLSGGMDIKGDIRRPYKEQHTICDMFHWEIKFNEHLNFWSAFKQAEGDALKDPTNPTPLVCFRRSRTEWRVVLKLEVFLYLLKELQAWRLSGDSKGVDRLSHLLSPIGTLPETLNKQNFEDWVVEKDISKTKRVEKNEKQQKLKEKYGKGK